MLAVGIVVDDAIVVVENVDRNIAKGLSPRDAARQSMDEVGAALIAIALVLCAVFVPSAFITGLSGQFLQAVRADHSGRNGDLARRLADAVAGALRNASAAAPGAQENRWWQRPLRRLLRLFQSSFDKLAQGYGWLASRVVRYVVIMLVVYAGIIAFGLNEFRKTPIGFIPALDRGYLIVVAQLPPGAALSAHRRRACGASSRLR